MRLKLPKRKYSGLPRWLDYVVQALYAISYSRVLNRPSSAMSEWATRLLNRYCACEKCARRQREEREHKFER